MSDSLARIVNRTYHNRDGIDYELTVYAAYGGLYGTFMCLQCGMTGVNHIFSPSEAEALELAVKAMEAHHRFQHQ